MSRPRAARIAGVARRRRAAVRRRARSAGSAAPSAASARASAARAVGRGVVDEEELPVGEALRPDRGDGLGERRRGVPDRGDDRDERRRRAPQLARKYSWIICPAPPRPPSRARRRRSRRAWCSCRPPRAGGRSKAQTTRPISLLVQVVEQRVGLLRELWPAVAAAGWALNSVAITGWVRAKSPNFRSQCARVWLCLVEERMHGIAELPERIGERRRAVEGIARTARPPTSSTFCDPPCAACRSAAASSPARSPVLGRRAAIAGSLKTSSRMPRSSASAGDDLAPGPPGRRRGQARRIARPGPLPLHRDDDVEAGLAGQRRPPQAPRRGRPGS